MKSDDWPTPTIIPETTDSTMRIISMVLPHPLKWVILEKGGAVSWWGGGAISRACWIDGHWSVKAIVKGIRADDV